MAATDRPGCAPGEDTPADCGCLQDLSGWRASALPPLIGGYLGLWLLFGFHLAWVGWPEGVMVPGAGAATAEPAATTAPIAIMLVPEFGPFGIELTFDVSSTFRDILLAAGAGLIGATAWALVSFAMQRMVGCDTDRSGFAPRPCSYYVVRPLAGPAVATLLYAALRAGVEGVVAEDVSTTDPISVFLIGALGGLFMVNSISVLDRAMRSLFRLDGEASSRDPAGGARPASDNDDAIGALPDSLPPRR